MVTVAEATDVVLSNLWKPSNVKVPLANAIGKILAEEIFSDRDLPPFDRVTMDGIAIAFSAWHSGNRKFFIEAIQAAGEPQKRLANGQACMEVMTGAMLPEGCDTVIRYEDIKITDGYATVKVNAIEAGQSIHRKGVDARQHAILLEPGLKISPAEIALLASVGKSEVEVKAFPRAAIISTGDELVDINHVPKAHEIRRSNSYALQASMLQMGWQAELFHIPDQKEILRTSLSEILDKTDVMILSGGVSKGKFDFVPEVLAELGVQKLFHQVSQRPGKPFWFGKADHKIVFALPGNPVSTFMCFHRYIRPWVMASLGLKAERTLAVLARSFTFEPRLTYFLQVSIKNQEGKLMAMLQPGGGSGDFANLKEVDGFLELPLEQSVFEAGEVFPFIPFRH